MFWYVHPKWQNKESYPFQRSRFRFRLPKRWSDEKCLKKRKKNKESCHKKIEELCICGDAERREGIANFKTIHRKLAKNDDNTHSSFNFLYPGKVFLADVPAHWRRGVAGFSFADCRTVHWSRTLLGILTSAYVVVFFINIRKRRAQPPRRETHDHDVLRHNITIYLQKTHDSKN